MLLHRPLVLVMLLASLLSCVIAQEPAHEKLFTISVAPPTSPKDVQVRYFLSGEFGIISSATTASDDKGQIVIRTEVESKQATTFRAIAYAPGCEFVTISVDDLSASNRQGQFRCRPLRTTLLQGRVPAAQFAGQDSQVEVLYSVDWAPEFFQIKHGAISPLTLTKVQVATDGTFAVELPDFAGDPLWPSLSKDAVLMFFLVDAKTGQRGSSLAAPADLSIGHYLKVASNYPGEVQFAIESTSKIK